MVGPILLQILVGTVLSWVLLLVVLLVSQGLADLSMPLWPELLWKVAAIAAAGTVSAALLYPVNWLLAELVSAAIFWYLLYRWFDVDFFGAIIIAVASRVVYAALMLAGVLTFLGMS